MVVEKIAIRVRKEDEESEVVKVKLLMKKNVEGEESRGLISGRL